MSPQIGVSIGLTALITAISLAYYLTLDLLRRTNISGAY